MIIDAMDILYTNDVDGFVLYPVTAILQGSSAVLERAERWFIGMGENKTPEPFRKACDKFTILENLMSEQNPGTSKSETSHDRRSKEKIEDAIIKMIIENQDINKPTGLGEVGSRLVSLYPDFDVRSYGYNMLSKFLEEFTRISDGKTWKYCVGYFKRGSGSEGKYRQLRRTDCEKVGKIQE